MPYLDEWLKAWSLTSLWASRFDAETRLFLSQRLAGRNITAAPTPALSEMAKVLRDVTWISESLTELAANWQELRTSGMSETTRAQRGDNPVWEYHIESMDLATRWSSKAQAAEVQRFQERLADLGAQGWEMIGYESVPMFRPLSGKVDSYAYLAFFKRHGRD